MNTRLLQYFIAAAECGSFTAAAESLYTTQPNFSKQIAALEREVGCRLFYREHRSIRLTPAGQVFYDRVRDVPGMLDAAVQQALQADREQLSRLQIGILEGHQLQPELLRALDTFQKSHPDCRLLLSRCDFDALSHGLESHRFDVIFTILFTLEHQPEIESRVLYPQQSYVAVNLQNPLAGCSELTIRQLSGETLVLLDEACSPASYRQLQSTLAGVSLRMLPVSSTDALFTSVEANVGLAIVDGHNRLLSSPSVRLIPLASRSRNPDFGAAWRKSSRKPVLQEFLRLLEQTA